MEEININPHEALQSFQRFTANEVSRLFGEIAGRDAVIEKLLAKIGELEAKLNG